MGRLADAPDAPGDEGCALLPPSILDRFEYWTEGPDAFFNRCIQKYGSTVVRVVMPPGRPFFPKSDTVMLLDLNSYPVLFDLTKVEKKDVFTGSFHPSWDYTGGYRVLSYLDPSEEKHELLKNFTFDFLKSSAGSWISEFQTAFEEASLEWEKDLSSTGKAAFATSCEQFTLNFLLRSIIGRDPATKGEASLGTQGPSYIKAWIAPQILPQLTIGLPSFLEYMLHTILVPIPYCLVASKYKKLYNFFWKYSQTLLDTAADKYGLEREEACHNLLFNVCFNTWGGFQAVLPSLFYRIAQAGPELHRDLAAEVRTAVRSGGITMDAINTMELVNSTVYEALRMDPPVPFQFGTAKEDLVIESHDGSYKVKKGELIGGYLGVAMKDSRVFTEPNEFRPKRFMGEAGEKLVQYVLWSNGRETESPTVGNKQCAGKNFAVFISRLLVVEFFLEYDSFTIGPMKQQGLTKVYNLTNLAKRSSY